MAEKQVAEIGDGLGDLFATSCEGFVLGQDFIAFLGVRGEVWGLPDPAVVHACQMEPGLGGGLRRLHSPAQEGKAGLLMDFQAFPPAGIAVMVSEDGVFAVGGVPDGDFLQQRCDFAMPGAI